MCTSVVLWVEMIRIPRAEGREGCGTLSGANGYNDKSS